MPPQQLSKKGFRRLHDQALKALHFQPDPSSLPKFLSQLEPNLARRVVNEPDAHGDTLLHFAAREHNLNMLLYLWKEVGGDPMAINEHGRQPLHEAIDSPECVSTLLEGGCDPNAMKRGDWTPLMIAAMKGNIDIIDILVHFGADLTRVNRNGWNALHLATQKGHEKTVRHLTCLSPQTALRTSNAGRLPIQTSIRCHAPFTLTLFLLLNSPLSPTTLAVWVDNSGATILHDAAAAGEIELIKILVHDYGADPNRGDKIGRTAVHCAAMTGKVEVLKVLGVFKDTDLEKVDEWDGWTPLMHGAKEGHIEVVRWLIERGCNARIKDRGNRTALELAKNWGHEDVVLLLKDLIVESPH